ncbi:hypothetical protein [Rhodohalobacter sulfatireducens]|uniref:Uncharacterized protein n=1 Tax=Rhodohalobacter sulfatireducens TaxID=2911366 RepID=A0ABS9KGB8_9BACT|nr:hypothetical protein [Rhodohalobacter sulfatireducens]MCG2589891.1 hypothetical protein [Rhodohalobacter sulfatireducens]
MSKDERGGAEPVAKDVQNEKLQTFFSWITVVILFGFGVFSLIKLTTVHETEGEFWKTLIREQFPVVIGLPMAGLGALFLTLVLRISTGPIEFEIGGVKFKGGAAPIVFWIFIFLCISTSIGLLWQS